jgi:antiviral helicase SKI2
MVDLSTLPPDYDEVVSELAHPFPFELDIFQKQAIYHLENNDNIFVAAHTSAGKTVVAEYAIALAQNHMTRAIYTSPIKALSNQKFRDFSKTFPEVGILTGDVQIKPESTCLIMTTEILRSMLYQGADLIRDVEFVIFDEVHYLNDAERGVVWEEVIIMLPSHITIILLSATVPNTKEFAEWIGRTKKRDVFVISTLKRPVPLEHYLYCNKELFKVINQNKQFLPLGWKQASDHLTKKDKERPSNQGNKRGRGGGSHSNQVSRSGGQGGKPFERLDRTLWVHLIGTLKQKNLLPVVIFAFSRKKCEEFADQLPNTDLTTSVEKSEIHLFLRKSLIRLKGEDRLLPQILKVSEWISRGIAVHHGGLLPIVKEIVEILFSRGLIKILFATETFAMGVNMPTRTVVFSGIRKFTGTEYRDLLPGEYTQMSGRAGRRGLDSTGMVIIVSQGDEVPDTVTLTKMILGPSTQLESQFRLTYSMIITLLRVEAFKVEDMIKRSFSENANQKLLPNKQKLLDERQRELDNLATLNCNICEKDIADYFKKDSKVREICKEVNEFIIQSSVGSKALSVGRVVVINNSFIRNCLAVVLKGAGNLGKSSGGQSNKGFYCLILVDRSTESNNKDFDLELNSSTLPFTHLEKPQTPGYKVLPVPVKDFSLISDINFQVNSDAIVDKKSDLESLQCMQNLLGLFDQLPLTEYDFKRLKLLKFQELNREKLELISSLRSDYNCIKCPDFLSHYRVISEEENLRSQLNDLYHVLSDQNLDLLPDYENRILVLMELNFIDDSMTVLLKGRVACEIKTADELLLTELILSNFFGAYTPEECVALLSCFIFQERLASEPNLTDNLLDGKNQILALAQTVGNIQVSKGVNISLEDYVQSFKFSLTEVVYEWAKGMTFKQITDLTTVQEGSIVRCMTRLNDLCRDVRNGARVIGDHGLYQKMEHASMCIRRDIVFAASLYL